MSSTSAGASSFASASSVAAAASSTAASAAAAASASAFIFSSAFSAFFVTFSARFFNVSSRVKAHFFISFSIVFSSNPCWVKCQRWANPDRFINPWAASDG